MYMRRNADFSATGSVIVSGVLGEQAGSLSGIVSYFIAKAEIYVESDTSGVIYVVTFEDGRLKPTLP